MLISCAKFNWQVLHNLRDPAVDSGWKGGLQTLSELDRSSEANFEVAFAKALSSPMSASHKAQLIPLKKLFYDDPLKQLDDHMRLGSQSGLSPDDYKWLMMKWEGSVGFENRKLIEGVPQEKIDLLAALRQVDFGDTQKDFEQSFLQALKNQNTQIKQKMTDFKEANFDKPLREIRARQVEIAREELQAQAMSETFARTKFPDLTEDAYRELIFFRKIIIDTRAAETQKDVMQKALLTDMFQLPNSGSKSTFEESFQKLLGKQTPDIAEAMSNYKKKFYDQKLQMNVSAFEGKGISDIKVSDWSAYRENVQQMLYKSALAEADTLHNQDPVAIRKAALEKDVDYLKKLQINVSTPEGQHRLDVAIDYIQRPEVSDMDSYKLDLRNRLLPPAESSGTHNPMRQTDNISQVGEASQIENAKLYDDKQAKIGDELFGIDESIFRNTPTATQMQDAKLAAIRKRQLSYGGIGLPAGGSDFPVTPAKPPLGENRIDRQSDTIADITDLESQSSTGKQQMQSLDENLLPQTLDEFLSSFKSDEPPSATSRLDDRVSSGRSKSMVQIRESSSAEGELRKLPRSKSMNDVSQATPVDGIMDKLKSSFKSDEPSSATSKLDDRVSSGRSKSMVQIRESSSAEGELRKLPRYKSMNDVSQATPVDGIMDKLKHPEGVIDGNAYKVDLREKLDELLSQDSAVVKSGDADYIELPTNYGQPEPALDANFESIRETIDDNLSEDIQKVIQQKMKNYNELPHNPTESTELRTQTQQAMKVNLQEKLDKWMKRDESLEKHVDDIMDKLKHIETHTAEGKRIIEAEIKKIVIPDGVIDEGAYKADLRKKLDKPHFDELNRQARLEELVNRHARLEEHVDGIMDKLKHIETKTAYGRRIIEADIIEAEIKKIVIPEGVIDRGAYKVDLREKLDKLLSQDSAVVKSGDADYIELPPWQSEPALDANFGRIRDIIDDNLSADIQKMIEQKNNIENMIQQGKPLTITQNELQHITKGIELRRKIQQVMFVDIDHDIPYNKTMVIDAIGAKNNSLDDLRKMKEIFNDAETKALKDIAYDNSADASYGFGGPTVSITRDSPPLVDSQGLTKFIRQDLKENTEAFEQGKTFEGFKKLRINELANQSMFKVKFFDLNYRKIIDANVTKLAMDMDTTDLMYTSRNGLQSRITQGELIAGTKRYLNDNIVRNTSPHKLNNTRSAVPIDNNFNHVLPPQSGTTQVDDFVELPKYGNTFSEHKKLQLQEVITKDQQAAYSRLTEAENNLPLDGPEQRVAASKNWIIRMIAEPSISDVDLTTEGYGAIIEDNVMKHMFDYYDKFKGPLKRQDITPETLYNGTIDYVNDLIHQYTRPAGIDHQRLKAFIPIDRQTANSTLIKAELGGPELINYVDAYKDSLIRQVALQSIAEVNFANPAYRNIIDANVTKKSGEVSLWVPNTDSRITQADLIAGTRQYLNDNIRNTQPQPLKPPDAPTQPAQYKSLGNRVPGSDPQALVVQNRLIEPSSADGASALTTVEPSANVQARLQAQLQANQPLKGGMQFAGTVDDKGLKRLIGEDLRANKVAFLQDGGNFREIQKI